MAENASAGRHPPHLPPELLEHLRGRKPELITLLQGNACRYCGARISWARPGAVVLADGMGAHLSCYEGVYP